MTRFLSRKFTLAWAGFIVGVIALFIGKATFSEFIALFGTSLGLYGVANVMEQVVQKKEELPTPPPLDSD